MKKVILSVLVLAVILAGSFVFVYSRSYQLAKPHLADTATPASTIIATATSIPSITSPLAITNMRAKVYPGSTITIEQTLSPGPNYNRYIASYLSDGLKIYGLLTVPTGPKPTAGWPVILLNHGYIPPAQYSTANSYAIMVNPLASAGYIVFKPDYRGNGNSQGTPSQPYVTPDYVTDSMNALESIRKYKDANPQKIGVLGHSMGGNIALHEMVMTHDIQAVELMAGVTGDATGLLDWWNQRIANHSIIGNDLDTAHIIQQMVQENGTPQTNPAFWNALDPTQFLSSVSTRVEIQVGSADNEVPVSFSTSLRDKLQQAGKSVTFHEYPGADHNLEPDTPAAMAEAVSFFNQYLK